MSSIHQLEKRVETRLIKSMAIKEACRDLYTLQDDDPQAYKKFQIQQRNLQVRSMTKPTKLPPFNSMSIDSHLGGSSGAIRNTRNVPTYPHERQQTLSTIIHNKLKGLNSDLSLRRAINQTRKRDQNQKRQDLFGMSNKAELASSKQMVTIYDQQADQQHPIGSGAPTPPSLGQNAFVRADIEAQSFEIGRNGETGMTPKNLTQPVFPNMVHQDMQRIYSKEFSPPTHHQNESSSEYKNVQMPVNSFEESSKIDSMRGMMKHEEYNGQKPKQTDVAVTSTSDFQPNQNQLLGFNDETLTPSDVLHLKNVVQQPQGGTNEPGEEGEHGNDFSAAEVSPGPDQEQVNETAQLEISQQNSRMPSITVTPIEKKPGSKLSPAELQTVPQWSRATALAMKKFENPSLRSTFPESQQTQQKLLGMIGEYRKRKQKEREHRVSDYHIMDNYIQVLTYLHQTNRFQQFFDPARLKMMIIKPASMDDQTSSNKDAGSPTVYGLPDNFLVGCQLYQQGLYRQAMEHFRKELESEDKTWQYEVRFNLGACLFKLAEYKMALRQFTTLMNEQKENLESVQTIAEHGGGKSSLQQKAAPLVGRKFLGRDRRLYFNKALCELQMGLFDQAIATCKQYLSPVKKIKRKLIQLEDQAKWARENDELTEMHEFDQIFNQFQGPNPQNDESREEIRQSSMAVIKDISRLNKVQLSPIAETQTQIKEASFVDYLPLQQQNHIPQKRPAPKSKNSSIKTKSSKVKFNQLAPVAEDKKNVDMFITFHEQSSYNAGQRSQPMGSERTSISHTPRAMSTGQTDALEKQRFQLRLLTQFQRRNQPPINVHCYPYQRDFGDEEPVEKSFEQIAKEASERLCQAKKSGQRSSSKDQGQQRKHEHNTELHPEYTEESDNAFIKELYRLKGFAYLRNQQKLSSMQEQSQRLTEDNTTGQEQQLFVVKAAANFQKAIGQNDGEAIIKTLYKHMRRQKRSKRRRRQLIDEENRLTKIRATFINFRRKLEGDLAEDQPQEAEDMQTATTDGEDDVTAGEQGTTLVDTDEKNNQVNTPEQPQSGLLQLNSNGSLGPGSGLQLHKNASDLTAEPRLAESPFPLDMRSPEAQQTSIKKVNPQKSRNQNMTGTFGQSSRGTVANSPGSRQSRKSKSSTAQVPAENYEDLATIYTSRNQINRQVVKRTTKAIAPSRHTSSGRSPTNNAAVLQDVAMPVPASMSKHKSQPNFALTSAQKTMGERVGSSGAPVPQDMRKSPSCRQLLRSRDHQQNSLLTRSPNNRSEFAIASGGRSQIFGMSHANSFNKNNRKMLYQQDMPGSCRVTTVGQGTDRRLYSPPASNLSREKTDSSIEQTGREHTSQDLRGGSQDDGDNEQQAHGDWLEKHVRFYDDYAKEGSHIKGVIVHDRKQSLDGQREEAQRIHAANFQLKDTANIKQMLGQRFSFNRIRGRYDNKQTSLQSSISTSAGKFGAGLSRGGAQIMPVKSLQTTRLTFALHATTEKPSARKQLSNTPRKEFQGRVSCPSLPVMTTDGKLTLPSIAKAKPSAQDRLKSNHLMQDEYQLDIKNQQMYTEEVSLNNSALYKMPEAYSRAANQRNKKDRAFTIGETWVAGQSRQ